MRPTLAFALLFTALTVPALGQDTVTTGAPYGWLFGGDYEKYEVGTAVLPRMKPGTQTAYIKAGADAECGAYGALFQTIAADKYRGKRLKFSARLFEQGLRGGDFNMFIFLRGPGGAMDVRRPAWDGLRQPVGVKEDGGNFRSESIIISVPAGAEDITFGFRLSGPSGTGWVDAVRLEVLSDYPPSPSPRRRRAPDSLETVQHFHGYQCALRKSWLTARGRYVWDERSLSTLARRTAPQGVQLALAAE